MTPEQTVQRVLVPAFIIAFGALMAYAIYLQANIWHFI